MARAARHGHLVVVTALHWLTDAVWTRAPRMSAARASSRDACRFTLDANQQIGHSRLGAAD